MSYLARAFGAVTIAFLPLALTGAHAAEPDSSSLSFQDWTVNCTTPQQQPNPQAKPGDKPPAPVAPICEMVQSFIDKTNQRMVARVAIGRAVAAGDLKLVVQLPVGVWLPDGANVTVPNKPPLKAIFTRCAPSACFAEADAKKDFVDAAKSADKLTLNFEDGARSPVALMVSTKGFAAALGALDKK